MKTHATQRSLKYLRNLGWTACVVEKWLPARGGMLFGRRIDAFGFGDILACHDGKPIDGFCPVTKRCIALVQTSTGARWNDHVAKLTAIPELEKWKAAGGLVILHGWSHKPKGGVRGAKKVWVVREETL